MKNTNSILYTFLLTILSLSLNAQDCEKVDYFGETHNVNCGGEDCVECFNVPFNLICDGSGFFNVIVSIAPNVLSELEESEGTYIVATGNVNDEIDESGQFISFVEAEGTPLFITFKKFDADDNLIAYGEINELSPPCTKGSNDNECPPDSNFEVEAELVYFEDYYFIQYNMNNGVKPYQIYDNILGQFYQASVNDDVFYLGSFPYSFNLNSTVIDAQGCNQTFLISAEPPIPGTDTGGSESTTSIEMISEIQYGLSVRPNPIVKGETANIYISVVENGTYNIELFDLTGKRINKIFLDNLNTGVHKIPFQTDIFNNGIFVAALKNNDGEILSSKKIILVD